MVSDGYISGSLCCDSRLYHPQQLNVFNMAIRGAIWGEEG